MLLEIKKSMAQLKKSKASVQKSKATIEPAQEEVEVVKPKEEEKVEGEGKSVLQNKLTKLAIQIGYGGKERC